MTSAFGADRKGSTTVEFALVAPALMLVCTGFVMLVYALWLWNALAQTATETARCVAVGALACSGASNGCADQGAGICYLLKTAASRGIASLRADQITIDTQAVRGGKPFTSVLVRYPFSVVGMTIEIKAAGDFPNLR